VDVDGAQMLEEDVVSAVTKQVVQDRASNPGG
jgi:hypothetical protein